MAKDIDRYREMRRAYDEAVTANGSEREGPFMTVSSRETARLADPTDIADTDYERDINLPGSYPFTRGVHPTGYRGKPWTIRMTLYRLVGDDARLQQFNCVEFVEELLYGHLRKHPLD